MTALIASTDENIDQLLVAVRSCRLCEKFLPLEPKPIVIARPSAKLLIIGQAPGIRVHKSGIPWNDPSGNRLRQWLGLSMDQFYDQSSIAIMPMGFCYPGTSGHGDLPPRRECAVTWHERIRAQLPNIELTLLIGQYAQRHYLTDNYRSLTERVKRWQDFLPRFMPLVHPSPRNQRWLKNNPWFERDVIPYLRAYVDRLLLC